MLEELDDRDLRKRDTPPKASNTTPKPLPMSRPRQSMTERESKVLTDMLDMIFTPQKDQHEASASASAHVSQAAAPPQDEVGPTQVNDLFSRLRRLATRRPTQKALAANAELFDIKKEQMNACASDQELLAWAAREVFDESVKYEAAAKRASADGTKKKTLPPLQSPVYPQMIAYLMRTFREHYRDPNLALYIFKYAQKLSTVSYTFGCSTDAYNELIETRWTAFKDLKGVLAALKEMDVNAVPSNNRTQQVVEQIRQDIGYGIHAEQDPNSKLLMEIEEVLAIVAGGKKTEYTGLGAWKKSQKMNSDEGFDDWSKLDLLDFNPKAGQTKLRGRKRLQ